MSRTTVVSMEKALGPQLITVTGVSATTHFAQVMVAADFRMKRLAMNFESAQMVDRTGVLRQVSCVLPNLES